MAVKPCAVCGRNTVLARRYLKRCCVEIGYVDPDETLDSWLE